MRIVKWTLPVLLGVLLLGLVVVPAVTASWHRRWGATSAEVAKTLPGDEQIPDTTARATRAVTVDAPPERVWPWIVQEGMGRAGWYTYDAFYTLTGSAGFVDGHSSDRIVPELQGLGVGDHIDINKAVRYEVRVLDRPRSLSLVMKAPDGTSSAMNYVLEPVGTGRTRLILRIASGGPPTFWSSGPFEFGGFVMSRANLLGIKARAEKR